MQISLSNDIFNPTTSLLLTIDQFYDSEDWTPDMVLEVTSGEMTTELTFPGVTPNKLRQFAKQMNEMAKIWEASLRKRRELVFDKQ